MKKLFLLISLLVLGFSTSVWADPYPLYQNISYCKLRQAGSGSTQFNITFYDGSGNSKLFVVWVEIGSTTRIEGIHRVALYSNSTTDFTTYYYDKDNDKYANPSGWIWFTFTGRFSGSDPIYRVNTVLQGYYSKTAYKCSFDKEIPVKIHDNNNNQYTITNGVTEVNIPGSTSHVASSSDGYFNYTGQTEDRLYRFESKSDSYEDGMYYGMGKYVDGDYTWTQSLPGGSNETPNNAGCNITNSNGYYFFEGYFNYNNKCYHVTMQHPNYQAVNTAYNQEFDWDNVTLARRADFATSGVVTLTATNASNKKVVLDFVVDKDEVGSTGDIVIPAGSYTISNTGAEGTVIASGGINTDLTVKNSYAGTTTALTSSNYSSNPLWCLISGTVTVGADQSVTVVANQSYRGSPVNITINGPITGGTQYTITVQTATPEYCTVSGGGEYFEGQTANISSTSKNEHLYIFDRFVEASEDEDMGTPSFNVEVTGNATYTAYYRLANSGTITAATNNASYGTASASLTGSQPGGTAVTLTATPYGGYAFAGWDDNNDGTVDNTDNPRTVYVDGNKEYVANFIVETASYASFSFDNPNDNIQIDKYTEPAAQCQTSFYPYGISLVEIIAKNTTRTSKNYLQMYIKTNNFRTYYPEGGSSYQGPAYGTYSVSVPSEYGPVIGNCDNSIYESNYYFVYTGDVTDVVIGYKVETASHSGTCHFQGYEGTLAQRLCIFSSYGADYSNETRSNFATFNSGTITVAEGAGGNPYITIRIGGTLAASIGAPAQPYNLAWDANGGELSGTYTAAGSVNEGTSITAPTATRTGYTFNGWSPAFTGTMPSNNVTYTAQWTATTYNLTYEGLEDATNTNPATYTIESGTITLAAPGARDGYAFTGWTINGTPVTEITHGSTGDKTLTANWNAKLSSITLEDNRENSFYNTFKTTYDGATGLVVTYKRQFTQGRWSTLCLPFDVNSAMFSSLKFGSHIYEFKYATGNANDDSGVNLYFSIAKSIKAGKGYIVNADAKLAACTSFEFLGVNIDLSADSVAELNSVEAYDNLTGSGATQGNIELVGTLRKGTLKGTATGNRYMGLKENKIYYPNITTGSTILAYRGIFRSIKGKETLNAERIRIIVDGEEKAELEVINGELQDVQETKKFIENGVLYIERNGIIYDATGRKVE